MGAMQEDVLLPSYRDNGALIWRGVKLEWSAPPSGADVAGTIVLVRFGPRLCENPSSPGGRDAPHRFRGRTWQRPVRWGNRA